MKSSGNHLVLLCWVWRLEYSPCLVTLHVWLSSCVEALYMQICPRLTAGDYFGLTLFLNLSFLCTLTPLMLYYCGNEKCVYLIPCLWAVLCLYVLLKKVNRKQPLLEQWDIFSFTQKKRTAPLPGMFVICVENTFCLPSINITCSHKMFCNKPPGIEEELKAFLRLGSSWTQWNYKVFDYKFCENCFLFHWDSAS